MCNQLFKCFATEHYSGNTPLHQKLLAIENKWMVNEKKTHENKKVEAPKTFQSKWSNCYLAYRNGLLKSHSDNNAGFLGIFQLLIIFAINILNFLAMLLVL